MIIMFVNGNDHVEVARDGFEISLFLPPVSRNVPQLIQQWSVKIMGHPASHLYKLRMKPTVFLAPELQ
jgi:hypothetical protein